MNDAIVIGGGHNGLICAALLAAAGKQVTLVEARSSWGGVAGAREFLPGYTINGIVHDTCTLSLPVVQELNLVEHGLQLCARPPIFCPANGGKGLLLHADAVAAATEIEAHSAQDVDAYRRYREFIKRISGLVNRIVEREPPDPTRDGMGQLWNLATTGLSLRRLGKRVMSEMLRVPPMPVADWMDELFESPVLKAALCLPAIQSTFAGPRSPGTAANLLFWEGVAGAAVQGGPAALIKVLVTVCESLGVRLRLGARVRRIDANGVVLESGEIVPGAAIVSSCDPHNTLLRLVAPDRVKPSVREHAGEIRMRGTIAKVHLAMKAPISWAARPGERFERVRIASSMDDWERAFDAVKYRTVPAAFGLDISVPTITNPSLAPDGHEVVSVMVHFVPHDLKGGWTHERRRALGDQVVEQLGAFTFGLSDNLVGMEVLAPTDIESQYGLHGGHLFHGEHALDQLLSMRPFAGCCDHATPVEGLYLCGSGTHPGGGITGRPGKLGANAVLRAL
jgi:phytoene dehydrogenase-like protein